ncbi:hypothetical protein [Longispora albida]|uniref:hypothetical protein n=1 Tax=Longispora albida TaxID=203523 RepID=UPI00036A9F1B|nr:hypothetical protein [Longispora albida]
MDVRELLRLAGSAPAPQTRLDPAELYAAGRRRSWWRGQRLALAGLVSALVATGVGATAYAISDHARVREELVSSTSQAAPPPPPAVQPLPATVEGRRVTATPSRAVTAAPSSAKATPATPAWDCATAAIAVAKVLSQRAEAAAQTSCQDGRLHVTASLGGGGQARLVLSAQIEPGPAVCPAPQALSCEDTKYGQLAVSGAAEVRLSRPDGRVITVATRAEGLWAGPAPVLPVAELRAIALALAEKT